jgi:phenylpropionate dioxygenase-like ring-hydroxylating dioxygenase large terminal subunit
LSDSERLPAEHHRAAACYPIFPAAVLKISPNLVECLQALPVSPTQCRIRRFEVALEDDRREKRVARYLNSRLSRATLAANLNICGWTDQGIRSGSYRGGILSDLESSVREFHRKVRELIPVARRRDAPAPGRLAALNDEMRLDD